MSYNHLINGEFLPFQESGIGKAYASKYFCIGDEMGLGKTWQGIGLSLVVGKPTLVVCPAGLRENWKKEFETLPKKKLNVDIIKKPSQVYYPFDSDVVIISYDVNMLSASEELFQWADVIIADEAHYISNMDSGRGGMFHKLLYECAPEYYLELSGTPIKNRAGEWYSLLRALYYKSDEEHKSFISEYPTKYEFMDKFSFSKKIRIKIYP